MLPTHPGGAAGTHGIREHPLPSVPGPQAACCPPSSHTSALSCTNPCCSPISSLPCKARGRSRAWRAPGSSLCSVWRSRSGDLYFISPGCCLLPGDARGSFELISREAAGFCGWWQQEYPSKLTASPLGRGTLGGTGVFGPGHALWVGA